jgi:hypothetical protein
VTAVDNGWVAMRLSEMATLLDAQGGNPYRAAAYRKAADTVGALGRDLREIHAQQGLPGLDALPGVGPRIAAAIAEMLATGGWRQLEHVRGDADPAARLHAVPGIGVALAHRLHEVLGVDTLEALEVAAHDGRLEAVPGVGPRRAAAIRASLAQMLGRRRPPRPAGAKPTVAQLLDVDREYRAAAQAGRLPTIAPRRFNPAGEAWLPVLHTARGDWLFTALFSNTARAHQLGRVHDWVVIYAEHPDQGERQYTVVTAAHGDAAGRRLVRGREAGSPATAGAVDRPQ